MLINNNLKKGFTIIELLVVICVIGILGGLTLAGVQKVRGLANNISCQNKLRQIGLAIASFHGTYGVYPPAWQSDSRKGISQTGWRVNLLPLLGEANMYQKIVSTKYDWPTDIKYFALSSKIDAYICPSDSGTGILATVPADYLGMSFKLSISNYFGISGTNHIAKNGVLFGGSTVRISDILDGTSNTVLVGEKGLGKETFFGSWFTSFGYGNGEFDATNGVKDFLPKGSGGFPQCQKGLLFPFQQPSPFDSPCSFIHFWSFHKGGGNFLFADGSVKFISYSGSDNLVNLSTHSGGEIENIN